MTRGRPGTPRLTRDGIVTEALSLAADRAEPFTLRRLAARLQVTPMAVLHHMGNHDALLHAMADALLAPIETDAPGDPISNLFNILQAYAVAICGHPGLTFALIGNAGPLPAQARRLTDAVETLLIQSGLSQPEARLRRDILIDWAHGMALAQAPEDPTPALRTLLAALTPERNAPR